MAVEFLPSTVGRWVLASTLTVVLMIYLPGCAHDAIETFDSTAELVEPYGAEVEGAELAPIASRIEAGARNGWAGADAAQLIVEYIVCRRNINLYDCAYRTTYTNSQGQKVSSDWKINFMRHPDGTLEEVIYTSVRTRD